MTYKNVTVAGSGVLGYQIAFLLHIMVLMSSL